MRPDIDRISLKIARQYVRGKTIAELCTKYQASNGIIRRAIERHAPIRPRGCLAKERRNARMLADLWSGLNFERLADKYRITPQRVRQIVLREAPELRGKVAA